MNPITFYQIALVGDILAALLILYAFLREFSEKNKKWALVFFLLLLITIISAVVNLTFIYG